MAQRFIFEPMKSQSAMHPCPFSMHDKTAWFQPHFNCHMLKRKFQEEMQWNGLSEKLCQWILKEATTKSKKVDMEMLKCLENTLSRSLSLQKMKHTRYHIFNCSALSWSTTALLYDK